MTDWGGITATDRSEVPKRNPRILQASSDLEQSLEKLSGGIEHLEKRLSAAMSSPEVPTRPGEPGLRTVELKPICEMEGRIYEQKGKVESLYHQIVTIMQRLEI